MEEGSAHRRTEHLADVVKLFLARPMDSMQKALDAKPIHQRWIHRFQ